MKHYARSEVAIGGISLFVSGVMVVIVFQIGPWAWRDTVFALIALGGAWRGVQMLRDLYHAQKD